MVNKVLLIGRVGQVPEVKHLDGGLSVAKFSLATSEKYKNKAGETVEETQWHNVTAWRNLAEICEKWVKKGDQLYVEGKITYRTYEDKDKVKRYATDIVADQIRMLGGKKEEQPAAAAPVEYTEPELPENDDTELPF